MPTASSSKTIRQVFDLAVSSALAPEKIGKAFAAEARRIRDGYIADGSASPTYETVVDGKPGAQEETARSSIVYIFSQLGAAVVYAYTFAVARSPAKTGRYRSSWVVSVNGALYEGDLEKIPADALVMLVNIQPYTRKLETSGRRSFSISRVTEDTRQAVARKFPTIAAGRAFVNLGSSLSKFGVEVPYILRGHAHRPHVLARRRTRLARRGVSYHAPGKDTARGAELTYPAVILSTGVR